ncbi:glycine oxidase ThiO [Klugiella xanthotipulae]|uniref:glycine oxidase n=1 Tax=Klugiella xanthotipulae TaxID=244735 RepID=A0A543HT67_9MICO|nr:glycine oxidase ThiO [Klugiella xanthotipulae]TQM61459.1 glycine oxidase [Klugiella xanthotipulae]
MRDGDPVDLIIVGGGIVGSLAAWRAVRAGLTVRWFDPQPGNGASRAAAGMLAPTFEAAFGERDLMRLNVGSAALWPKLVSDLASETGCDLQLRQAGTLTVAFDSGDLTEARRVHDLHEEWGLSSAVLTTSGVRQRLSIVGSRVAGGLWAAHDHSVNPRRVISSLVTAVAARGVAADRRHVVSLLTEYSGSTTTVSGVLLSDGSTVQAERVLVAAGWESGELLGRIPGLVVPTRPVKGEVVRLDASGLPWLDIGYTVRGLVQGRPIYLVPRPGGEIVIGATTVELPDDREMTAGGLFALLRDARAIVPGIDEAPVRELMARARPGTPDNLPLIGRVGDGSLLVATGHYRHGILLAALTDHYVNLLLRGDELPAEARVCDPNRFSLAARVPIPDCGDQPAIELPTHPRSI